MSGFPRWWAVTGSDPVWWLIVPLLLLLIVLFGPFWLAARAIRKMEDWPDWLDCVGEKPVAWVRNLYMPRSNRRVKAWRDSIGDDE